MAAGSQIVSSPGRWLRARRSRAHQVAGSLIGDLCELGAADHYFGKESLTSKDHFWKGSCQSLLIWNKEIITL
ncbi:UNVERIFIED_CONTAM: hypothetical protein Slati_4264100 [Sesamum latifolium]|uniref:Uncharacterized protein n=1 Tax=Sesamum latifolium TaxID=2727402 RepID=A0AAW2TCS2_9LAMI